jgi:hypothetical protein
MLLKDFLCHTAEVATLLFLSPRAIDAHLSAALGERILVADILGGKYSDVHLDERPP